MVALLLAACGPTRPADAGGGAPETGTHRVTAADGSFGLAVPAGWKDVTPSWEVRGFPGDGYMALSTGPLPQPPAPDRYPTVIVAWVTSHFDRGTSLPQPVATRALTIAGQRLTASVYEGLSNTDVHRRDVAVPEFFHTIAGVGRRSVFAASCSEPDGGSSAADDVCFGILSSWVWSG